MRKKIEWKWEQIDEATWRAKVIGGWVLLHVKTFTLTLTGGKKEPLCSQSESMQFIADRDHEWHILEMRSELVPIRNNLRNNLSKDFEPAK